MSVDPSEPIPMDPHVFSHLPFGFDADLCACGNYRDHEVHIDPSTIGVKSADEYRRLTEKPDARHPSVISGAIREQVESWHTYVNTEPVEALLDELDGQLDAAATEGVRGGIRVGEMNYSMTAPCDACPFANVFKNKNAFTTRRLLEFCSGEFPCHKTADNDDDSGEFIARDSSAHCAGALIFMEKRNRPHQMARIAERLGMYDPRKLDMKAKVR